MNRVLRTILIISVAIFAVGLSVTPTQAQVNEIDVAFEETPLFKEVNFLPGDEVSRTVEVENIACEKEQIGVSAANYSGCPGPYCLADKLNLVISEGGDDLYTGTLAHFLGAGEVLLSNLLIGSSTIYTFSVTFDPQGDDNYQGLTTEEFDFNIGCFGGEAIGGEAPPFPPDDGGGFAGLDILYEHASGLGTEEVTIIWITERGGFSAKATSRVIYSRADQGHDLDRNSPPNYGYASSTVEDPEKVVGHSVTITGLTPGVTYYYRCVSHTSPDETISRQHSFTTKGVAGEEFYEEEEFEEPVGEGITEEEEAEELVIGAEAGAEEVEEEEVGEEGKEEVKGLNKFLAAVGSFFNLENLCWILFFFIVVLIIFFLLSKEKKEKEAEEKKRWWILPLVIVLLIILYCLFCPNRWILILIALISFILFLLLRKRKKKGEESKTQSLFGKGF